MDVKNLISITNKPQLRLGPLIALLKQAERPMTALDAYILGF